MLTISIQADIREAVARLDDAAKRQVPFATALALTALAVKVQLAERAATKQVFRRPRPFTQRFAMYTKATKSRQVATVYASQETDRYLAPFEFGGKHFVPGKGIGTLVPVATRLDAYGQISGQPRNIGDADNTFVGRVNTKRGPIWGFWQRLPVAPRNSVLPEGYKRRQLRLLAKAIDPQTVQPKLGFADRAREVVAANVQATFSEALGKALATAR